MACGEHLFPYCELVVRRSRKCPLCGETGIPILYGYPTTVSFEAAEREELHIGGCIVMADQPTQWCPSCDAPLPTTSKTTR